MQMPGGTSPNKYDSVLFCIMNGYRGMVINQYLADHTARLLIFSFNLFSIFPGDEAVFTLELYEYGRLSQSRVWRVNGRSSNVFKYAFMYLYFFRTVLLELPRGGWILVTHPFFCIGQTWFRFLKRIRTAFWVWDHFGDTDPVFAAWDDRAIRMTPVIRYTNRRMFETYDNRVPRRISAQDVAFLTHGTRNFDIPRRAVQGRLGLISNLRPADGSFVVLDSLLLDPLLTLDIIGRGESYDMLREIVVKSGLGDRVRFFGQVDDQSKLDEITAEWQIGLAPYLPDPSRPYCAPGKLKTYWQQGLPVIVSDVTPDLDEFRAARAGEVVSTDSAVAIVKAAQKIMADYGSYLPGVGMLRAKYDYVRLYDAGLAFMSRD